MATNVRLIGGYDSDLATATSSSGTASGYDVTNVVTLDRSSLWVSSVTTSIVLHLDFGSAKTINCFALANHNGGGWTTALLQTSPDNSAWTTKVTLSGMTSGYDWYGEFDPAVSVQYVRLTIASATAAPQVGIFYAGDRTTLTYNPWIGFDSDDVYNVEKKAAQSGAVVAEQWGRQLTRYGMRWEVVETTAKDQLRDFLRTEGGPLRPFFYVPREDSTTTTQGRAYVVRMVDESFRAKEIFGGLWAMSVDLQEEV